MNDVIESIAKTIHRDGLHKLASRVMAAEGLTAPTEWSLSEIGLMLGTKIAQDRATAKTILSGLGSLYELTGSVGEKTAHQSVYQEFYRVKMFEERLGKTASYQDDLTTYKVALWRRCKLAAANDEEGQLLGLAKLAVSFFGKAIASGEKTASSQDEVLNFASSFACGLVVDDAIDRMIKTAEVSPDEGLKLAVLNAESTFQDLLYITRTA